MRLIELRANKDSFRTVKFNRKGLTLVVGKKTNPNDKDREHSTNGVGKSLLLYLINFCLASSTNDQLKENLPGWEFTLVFNIKGTDHTASRATDDQESIVFDGTSMKLEEVRTALGKSVFELPDQPIKFLTFRSLIGLFLRQGKPAYITYSKAWNNETAYSQQLRNCYLLGIDEQLVDKKRELKEEKDRIKSIRSQFKNDSLLREYFQGERDAGLELKDLEEEIENLESEAKDFRVAKNYEEISVKADETRRRWRMSRNELHSLKSSLKQISSSLSLQPEVSLDEVKNVYEAAKIELPNSVVRKMEEVARFHEDLITSRSTRLTKEKHRIERRISELELEIKGLDSAKDEYYQFLGTHGALQEYETLLNTLADRRKLASKLSDFQDLKKDCDGRWQRNKLEMSKETVRATEYLASSSDFRDKINERYRLMARRIWPRRTCGLLIENNDGDNKIRFSIDARIQGDASDGTGETKIFCFDMTVLLGGQNHDLKFLMHDNRLYPGIDHRQRAELFRIAHEFTRERDCQYIATINEENLLGMKGVIEPTEFQSLLESNVVRNLMDDSDEGKLLGITIDLLYEN